jgi:hypothetical protein
MVVTAEWRKSSRSSGAQNCVEVAYDGVRAALRDSKNRDGARLVLTASSWRELLSAVTTHR